MLYFNKRKEFMKQGLNQQLSQQQKLSQQMVQAISLLSISTNELAEVI